MRTDRERQLRREQKKRWRARNPEKARAKERAKYRRRHGPPKPERPCIDCKGLTKRGPLAIRCLKCWRISVKLKDKWGMTRADYDALLASQGGSCAICRGQPNGKGKFHVDHCHRTGKIRGLLCAACNMGIGQLRDDPAVLRAAADYLTQHAEGSRGSILGAADYTQA